MKIKLSANASIDYTKTTIEVQSETLICNGVSYDFSVIPDGAEVEAREPAIGTIKRVNGEIEITLQYCYNAMDCVEEERFPNADGYIVTNGKLEIGAINV